MKSIQGRLNSAIAKDMKKFLARGMAGRSEDKENIKDGSTPKLS